MTNVQTEQINMDADDFVPKDDHELPDFVRYLGVPGLIDAHVHFMPDNVMSKVWQHFESGGPMIGPFQWPIRYKGTELDRVNQLKSFGVSHFTSLLYPHRPDMAEWLNSWAAEFAARHASCIRSATFFCEESATRYVREAIEDGVLVFKAHLQVGGYDPLDELLAPVWGMLSESGTPVVVHCGSAPVPGRYTGSSPIETLLARYPRLRLIIAHLGQPEYKEFLDLALSYDEVYLDTTLVFTDFCEKIWPFPRDLVPRLSAAVERVLLGTDFPNLPDPYSQQLAGLTRLGLGQKWLRAVCYLNSARLFGRTDGASRVIKSER